MTVYFHAQCELKGFGGVGGFHCSDEGESVASYPLSVKNALSMSPENVLVMEMDEYRSFVKTLPQYPYFVTVEQKLTIGGALKLSFRNPPLIDKDETWPMFRTTNAARIEGSFRTVEANVTNLDALMTLAEILCFDIAIRVDNYGTALNITTRRYNKCLRHPGVVAAVVLSVLGAFFGAITLLVIWRKRRFNRLRAAALSSPLADAEMQEYGDTAKMIESTSGRFEIGDDDIDDPEL